MIFLTTQRQTNMYLKSTNKDLLAVLIKHMLFT